MSINAEILMELLEDYDVYIGKYVAERVADQFAEHLSECNINYSIDKQIPTEKEENLERLIRNLKHENQVYRDSVKERTGAVYVYIDNGEVKYDLR